MHLLFAMSLVSPRMGAFDNLGSCSKLLSQLRAEGRCADSATSAQVTGRLAPSRCSRAALSTHCSSCGRRAPRRLPLPTTRRSLPQRARTCWSVRLAFAWILLLAHPAVLPHRGMFKEAVSEHGRRHAARHGEALERERLMRKRLSAVAPSELSDLRRGGAHRPTGATECAGKRVGPSYSEPRGCAGMGPARWQLGVVELSRPLDARGNRAAHGAMFAALMCRAARGSFVRLGRRCARARTWLAHIGPATPCINSISPEGTSACRGNAGQRKKQHALAA